MCHDSNQLFTTGVQIWIYLRFFAQVYILDRTDAAHTMESDVPMDAQFPHMPRCHSDSTALPGYMVRTLVFTMLL